MMSPLFSRALSYLLRLGIVKLGMNTTNRCRLGILLLAASADQRCHCLAKELPPNAECHCQFISYTPAPLESLWVKHIKEWEHGDVCANISDRDKMSWLNQTKALQAGIAPAQIESKTSVPPLIAWNYALSVYTFKRVRGQWLRLRPRAD